jgi:hypothetical protein
MINNTTFYRWAKFKNGIGSVAIVTIEVEKNSTNQNQILENYNGQGFTSQGEIDEVTENGYNSWKIGARNGLDYAFSLIDSTWSVRINKIEGRIATDTNPTIVGYTVLRAFLYKINLELTQDQIKTHEDYVFSSWTNPYKELIPDFFNLSFKEFEN